MPRSTGRRSRLRRAGESAFGVLLVMKSGVMALLALLLVVAGVWTSLSDARPAMSAGSGERGTLVVRECGTEECRGRFEPAGDAGPVPGVSIGTAVAAEGERVPVALRPGSREAVRTGAAGVLYAWVPLAGALVLGALVVAGGLRMVRTAWVMGLLGAGVMVGAFALL
ncbi:hypothetical protein [Streptomyces sp. JJ36]|uniref:hypothetical protein n=1 Tax=Streptomyces sp. JJ36 TaxID=2736645 RepID=UPI001F34D34B|nr:hypothetical protein [Streptomyces sp. JJ36]MCF6522232.1 hypothetical protein [Streptomyces sp. JJ36]